MIFRSMKNDLVLLSPCSVFQCYVCLGELVLTSALFGRFIEIIADSSACENASQNYRVGSRYLWGF